MKIGTHDGKFHADEVFSIAILRKVYPSSTIVRTRNIKKLSECDMVVDVGGGKYDHHTVGKVYRENKIPYASAGLIWRDFGRTLFIQCGIEDERELQQLVQTIDEKLIQGIDAIDNGVNLERDSRIRGIPEIIGGFNPTWNETADEDRRFMDAVAVAIQVLENQISLEMSRIAAVHLVLEAYQTRGRKEILEFNAFVPWAETLLHIDSAAEVQFVIFPDKINGYRIQVVPKIMGSFEARKPLPESWAGKEEDELGAIIGIPDAIFCHPARFIAGARTHESVMVMANLALETPS